MAAGLRHFNFPQGSPPYGKYKSYSYRFDTPGRVVVFSGDTGPSDALTELAKGTEVMLSDDLVAVYKSNGIWQSKTPAEQAGNICHLQEEHITREVVGKWRRRRASRQS